MKKTEEVQTETQTEVATVPGQVVIEENTREIYEPNDPRIVPDNKYVAYHLENGYDLLDFRTRSLDEVKEFARSLREGGLKKTTYVTLKQGWYGVFAKDATPRLAKAAKAVERISPPLQVGEHKWASTKEARAFARMILEAAKQAEWEADHAAALAKKSGVEA